jgi:guanine deaminase
MTDQDKYFLQEAIKLGREGVESSTGGPFGAVVVKDGKIIGRGCNRVSSSNDPTAHAEVVAIRDACSNISDFQLDGAIIYSSCEPCPMCLGALYWARPARLVFASTKNEAAAIGFDDAHIYQEIPLPLAQRNIPTKQVSLPEADELFLLWKQKTDRVDY